MTCPVCKDLYSSEKREDSFPVPIKDCRSSVLTSGCDACKLLCDILEHFNIAEEASMTVDRSEHSQRKLRVSTKRNQTRNDVAIEIFVLEGGESGHPLIGCSPRARRVPEMSNDEESFDTVSGWIGDCNANHANCNFDATPMPTRVINVGLDGGKPFLFETKGRYGQYATLSYCWGKSSQLMTKKSNLEDFKKILPTQELSTVVQHAIRICQKLTINYLWVDAACIVQDDEEDWLREADQMCDIYSSSYLTIAAMGSADNKDGIFSAQYFGSAKRIASFPFRGHQVFARVDPFKDHLGHPLGLNFEEQDGTRLAVKSWLLRSKELPLVRRAWAVQERLLSRRTLYYTRDEIYFECDSWWRCECGYSDEEKYPDNEDSRDFLHGMTVTQEVNRGAFDWLRDANRRVPVTLNGAYHKWRTIISMFAAGELTHAKDKLPALSGVAQQFKRMLQDRFNVDDDYCVGMWRGDLQMQLLWTATSPSSGDWPLGPRSQDASIPSWSWLVTDADVHYFWHKDLTPRCRILDVFTVPVSNNWAGLVKGARLTLEGFVVHNQVASERPHQPDGYSFEIKHSPTKSSWTVWRDTSDPVDGPLTCLYTADADPGELILEKPNPELSEVYCVFLVLKLAENTKDAYVRCGLGVTSIYEFLTEIGDAARMERITIV